MSDYINALYGRRFNIPDAHGGGYVDWGQVDETDLDSVRNNLPPCQARADLVTRLLLVREVTALRDALLHALVGASGDDVRDTLDALANPAHLATDTTLSPSIMRYLNDIARANSGIGLRMDYQDAIAQAVSRAVHTGGPVDYQHAAQSAADLEPARNKVRDEDVAYINEEV